MYSLGYVNFIDLNSTAVRSMLFLSKLNYEDAVLVSGVEIRVLRLGGQ